MALEQTVQQALASLEHEMEVYQRVHEVHERYKDLSPEEIASPAHLQQAAKDQQALEAASKALNAALPTIKRLAEYTTRMATGVGEISKTMALTLIKLHGAGKTAPQIQAALDDVEHQIDGAISAVKQATVQSMAAHPKVLQYAIKEDTKTKLTAPASEAGDHWQKARTALGSAEMALSAVKRVILQHAVHG
jgi:Zn-dependent M32 family carboxypeptidase